MIRRYILSALLLTAMISQASAQQNNNDQTFTVEGYYKAKWGYADEFIELFKKNHYPLLKKALEKGDIISIKAEKPRLHSTEESRWDYRVTLVFKNIQAAFDPNLTTPYKKALYPDADKLKKEEQRRFEILDGHWDVQVQTVELDK
jgi:serine protease inhibitor ecotin